MEKRVLNFWSEFGVFRENYYKFYITISITTLIWVAIWRANWKMFIICYFSLMSLAYFVLLKVFLIVFYFTNRLFKRKSVKDIYPYLKSAIFLSLLSWMKRRKSHLKYLVWRRGYKKIFGGGRVWSLIEGLEIFQKKADAKKGAEKKVRGVYDPQRNYGFP